MDRVLVTQEILAKIAGINVLFNAALDADVKWQKDFIKENWQDCRQSLINSVLELMGGENDRRGY